MDLKIILSPLIILISTIGTISGTTFQWTPDGTWQRALQQPGNSICVDIPSNMSLCHGIGYTKMRLPNLLHHDSLQEVSQQAISWIPLFQLNCHPDTQIFLCSLFTPVCLEHPIPPCRSLCLTVQSSCEDTMSKYGYPWPHIVRCDQFPVDNDMCIMPQHGLGGGVVGLPTSEESRKGGGGGGGGGNSSLNLSQPVELYPDGTPKGIVNQTGRKGEESTKKRRKSKKNRNIISSTSSPFSAQDLTTGSPSSPSSSSSISSIPASSHVHHHLQTMTEQQETLLEASPPPTESGIHSASISVASNENKVHVQERILSGYCHSEWSLKVKATATRNPDDGSITLHVKSYRVLWGLFLPSSDLRPSLITVPANVSQEIASSYASSSASSVSSSASSAFDGIKKHTKTSHHAVEDKSSSRFYVMGNTKGHQFLANFVIFWPHKSPHFRKALKDIKNGSVECSLSTVAPSTTTVESSTVRSPEQHGSRGEKRRRRKQRRKLHHHHSRRENL